MKPTPLFPATLALIALLSSASRATEFHVAPHGDDVARGTRSAPLRSIQRAADIAQPGDVITVHQGVYRERVNPPRGGTSDRNRIVYRAAPGERVEIKGSEVVTNWTEVQPGVWKAAIPNALFRGFNPFADRIRGDWFNPKGREHHTGAVYLNGEWLAEAARMEDVLAAPAASVTPLWFATVDKESTTVWAQFGRANPNTQQVEVNARRAVFYPDQPGRNYITVRGFVLQHAATPWAPPTAEQVGLIGTHWSQGWIIEDNVVSHSTCSGISLGKHGDAFDNTSADTAEGYVKTIERAHAHAIPWTRENIGHHIVRNNVISHCEQAGIVGSLGAAFSTVTGNEIHDIHVRRLFTGAEMAGIKFHGAIDTVIRSNHIHHTCLGLWLDWMAQGTRVSANLFHDNAGQDLFVEVNHGPFVVDNNLFLSGTSQLDMSEGGAYVHNLFAGKINCSPEPNRETPYHPAHSTAVAGLASVRGGDDRFYNNVFVGDGSEPRKPQGPRSGWIAGHGLWVYDGRGFPLQTGGNVYWRGALPYGSETNSLVQPGLDPGLRLERSQEGWILHLNPGSDLRKTGSKRVSTATLGKAIVPGLPYESADGSPVKISTDYFGRQRNTVHPTPGPFEVLAPGPLVLPVR